MNQHDLSHEDTVQVMNLDSFVEGELYEDVLMANGIRCLIRLFNDPNSFGSSASPGHSWGELRVLKHDADTARRVIKEFQTARRAPGFEM